MNDERGGGEGWLLLRAGELSGKASCGELGKREVFGSGRELMGDWGRVGECGWNCRFHKFSPVSRG